MTKKYPITYIHPTLDRKCIIESEGNCNYVTMGENILMKGEIKPFYFNESYLKSLGFIEAPTDTEEKEENKEEPKDWIDRAFNEFHIRVPKHLRGEGKEFRQAIQKHIPQEPVGKELIPLDVKKCANEINDIIQEYKWGQDKEYIGDGLKCIDDIEAILSKYGHIQKQEERIKLVKEGSLLHFPLTNQELEEEVDEWLEMCGYPIEPIAQTALKKIISKYLPTPKSKDTSVDVEELKTLNSHELMLYDMESMMYTQLYTLREQQTHENRINIAKSYIKKRQERGFFSLPIQKKRSKEQLKAYIDFKIVCRTRGYKEAFTDDVLQMFQDYYLLQD